MKISYKVLEKYLSKLESPEKVAEDLIMHTAEVEEIISQKEAFQNIVFWKITSVESHPDADSLRVCMVNAWEAEDIQIVCGWSNLEVGQGVAVAKLWAVVSWHGTETVTMKKTKIRWVESYGMICASEEIGLASDFPAKDSKEILDISFLGVKEWTALDEALGKDDAILEVDNKAINHRPDLFSHIWVIRELATIRWEKTNLNYEEIDFTKEKELKINNEIPELVRRYSMLSVNNVENIESTEDIKTVIDSGWVDSKGLLVDISNYSLYFYGQPTHCFDADKVNWEVTIRKAKSGEKFIALDDKEYELNETDIVIADSKKVLALWGIIWGKSSAVSDETKNILIESAHFDQAVLRMTWKRLWVRTDSLNVFEKDTLPEVTTRALALIYNILKQNFKDLEIVWYADSYEDKQEQVVVDFDLNYINNLIGKNYEKDYVLNILANLWVEFKDGKLYIPFWRKELNNKSDIAEEIARIDGYDNVESTVPRVNLWAVKQTNMYNLKKDLRDFFVARGWYDMYNYSFVWKDLMEKLNSNLEDCIPLKNFLSEDASHMRNSLIPNLMKSLEENVRDLGENLSLFEFEKAYNKAKDGLEEKYLLSGVKIIDSEIAYYDIVSIISDLFETIHIDKFSFDKLDREIAFSHSGRTAKIIVRWKEVWVVWEIHPSISKRFDIKGRVAFFEIDMTKLENTVYNIVKYKEISAFQMNNFDLSFVVDKQVKWSDIQNSIALVNKNLIKKVELFDIFESEEKLPWKRSLSFKIFIQSDDWTLDDNIKSELIFNIVDKVKKKWGELR